jgi:hypothetical protein
MIKHRMNGQEVAILTVDLLRLPDLGRVRVSPFNSGAHEATPHLADDADVAASIDRCNELDAKRRAANAEILVRDGVPLSAIYGVVFCDAVARDAWWPTFVVSLPDGVTPPEVRTAAEGKWYRLPDDYRVDERAVPIRAGIDHLVGPTPAGWLLRLPSPEDEPELEEPHWMDLDDWDTSEEEEGPTSWADFYDDGSPDDPDWYEPSLRD